MKSPVEHLLPAEARLRHVLPLVRRFAAPLIALVICALLMLVFQHVSRHFDYKSVVHTLRNLSPGIWAASLGATTLSYVALVARDAIGLRYVGETVPRPALWIGATVGSALGNATGFGALTGGAVRCRVYGTVGVQATQVGRLTAFTSVTLALSLALMTGVGMLFCGTALSPMFRLPASVLQVLGGVIVAAFAALLVVCRAQPRTLAARRLPWLAALELSVPSRNVLLCEMLYSVADVTAAGLALWVILPHGNVHFISFIAIYAAALLLGMIGHTPGGLGIFEAAMVFALGRSVSTPEMVAALLAYRAIYFIVPLVFSAGLLAAFEGRLLSARFAFVSPQRIGWLAPLFLGIVTFAVGSMLVISGALPAYRMRLLMLSDILPLWVLESSQLLASLMGVLLLFVARGLVRRLDAAWWLATVLAAVNLALALTKGLAFVEAAVLGVLLVLLIATRRQFNRSSSLFAERFTIGWLVSVGIVVGLAVWIMFFAFRDIAYTDELWWGFAFDERAPRALRATVGAGVFAAAIAVWQLLRPAAGRFISPPPGDLDEAFRIVRAQERSDAGLAMMGDKSFLFSASRQSFLMYAKRGRTWAALHDPVGPREEWAGLIRDFVLLAHAHGGRAAFYQVRADALPLYLDSGLTLMKLGEEAQIPLKEFSMVGPHRANLRYALKRGEKDGLSVGVVPANEVPAFLPTLRRVSNAWLDSRSAKEKSFSVAAFKPDYLIAQSVMVVYQNQVAVAFATFMTTDLNTEATIGVMRHVPEASAYTMEYLFTTLALHLKEAGFSKLSLGMSPLSGMQAGPLASPWYRLASLTWKFGGRFYNFRGLRAFKNKFQPRWEPRYLAASGSVGVLFTLADLSLLAGGWRS
ncbi:MAG: bifunctional lysylphosphatidylglycerol flippase/synthetase MprF [Janthinobacterium lividum]